MYSIYLTIYRKNKILSLLILSLMLLLAGCTGNTIDVDEEEMTIESEDTKPPQEVDSSELPKESFLDLLTPEETSYIDTMRSEGGLIATIRKSGPVYRVDNQGHSDGFHYNLVSYLAEQLDVPLTLNVVLFHEYFELNGEIPNDVKTNESTNYTPDVLKQSHLISDNLTVLVWRERLMDFVDLIPVSIVVMTSDGLVVQTESDLTGLRVAVEPNTSYFTDINALNEEMDLDLTIIPVESGSVALDYLLEGKADFTLKDSNAALYEAKLESRLNVSMSISDPEYIGWAIKKENETFKDILNKFVQYALENGELDRYWEKEYGVPLRIYSELLGVFDYRRND